MSGVRRFLSRRDKSPYHHRSRSPSTKTTRRPDHFGGIFAAPDDPQQKPDKEQEKKIKGVLERLRHYGIDNIVESNVEYALQASEPQGDPQAAFQLLMLLEDTYEGIVKPYDPEVKMLGAVNRQGVSCYLDALLFAMFARLDGFEAMLYDSFDDIKRRKLAGLMRLWVNLLRSGKLITTDITGHLQTALSELGWTDAGRSMQQDPSEAFTFITGHLELPMLTLKMDMFHTGKEDPHDDHKFVNERLLEVAVLDEPSEGNTVITLEDCLEHYFNNRIEVKRHLQNQRRNTLKTAQSTNSDFTSSPTKIEKESGTHVEVVELGDTPTTPVTPTSATQPTSVETPSQSKNPVDKLRPLSGRKRADSIFSQRTVELTGVDPEALSSEDPHAAQDAKGRKMSTRTEVLMPAWQFFKLLPWYTDNMPTSDAQVAAHFSKKRPVLGICLKRYLYTNQGQARRLDTYIDIPLEIAVPHFVGDDSMHEEGPLVGNFRLMLQSVVCHRGVSVHSGHYICLSRARASSGLRPQTTESRGSGDDSDDSEDPWLRFDDLAKERVSLVDIREALKQEMPYLLFYQVQPIGEDGNSIHDLPSYAEATSRSQPDAKTSEKPFLHEPSRSENALNQTSSEPMLAKHASTDTVDLAPDSTRTSLDTGTMLDASRSRLSTDGQRRSIAFDQSSNAGSLSGGSIKTDAASYSNPVTPSDEKGGTFLSVANKISGSRRGSRVSKTTVNSKPRPQSVGPDSGSRFNLNVSKLTQRMSRGEGQSVNPSDQAATELGVQTDADDGTTLPDLSRLSVRSQDSVATAKLVPPKLPKQKSATRLEKRDRTGKAEDRECVLM